MEINWSIIIQAGAVFGALYAAIIAHVALRREANLEKRLNKKEIVIEISGMLTLLLEPKPGDLLPYKVDIRNVGGTLVQVTRVWINSIDREDGAMVLDANRFGGSDHLPVSLRPGESLACYFNYGEKIVEQFFKNGRFFALMQDGTSSSYLRTETFFINPDDPRIPETRKMERKYEVTKRA